MIFVVAAIQIYCEIGPRETVLSYDGSHVTLEVI